jgi:hypothetical protein
VAGSTSRTQRDQEAAAPPEERPEEELYVYCKGCGQRLESRARLSKPKAVVSTMMCESCREIHGHALMPRPGAPTFCYRCGTEEQSFVAPGISPAIYHVCPRCLPDRIERYSAGDFETPPKVVAGKPE